MTKALSGKDKNNRVLSIPEWNEASMYATGVPINTPCDGPGGVPPLSRECLTYLFENKGAGQRIGSTYTLPNTYASKDGFQDVSGNTYITKKKGCYLAGLARGGARGDRAPRLVALKLALE
jgi:hypothetical protein